MHGHCSRPLEVLRGYRRPPALSCGDIGVVIGAGRGGGVGVKRLQASILRSSHMAMPLTQTSRDIRDRSYLMLCGFLENVALPHGSCVYCRKCRNVQGLQGSTAQKSRISSPQHPNTKHCQSTERRSMADRKCLLLQTGCISCPLHFTDLLHQKSVSPSMCS